MHPRATTRLPGGNGGARPEILPPPPPLPPEVADELPAGDLWAPAGTPPCAFEFMGAKPTSIGWLVPCPRCCQGWAALRPDGTAFGYRLAAHLGCSAGCQPAEIALWHALRLGDLAAVHRLRPQPEPDEEERRYLIGALRHAARRIGEAREPLTALRREARSLAALAAGIGADPAEIARALAVVAHAARLQPEAAAVAILEGARSGASQPRGIAA